MAIIANAATTYNTIGNREELSDLISLITPVDVELQKLARKGTIENRFFEWQTDSLAATSTIGTGALEGEIAPTATYSPTVRLGNQAQILQIAANVTGTEQVVKKAGRGKDEMAYQLGKKAKELKRNIENQLLNNTVYNAGNTTTGRVTRGLNGWLDMNASIAGVGASASIGGNLYTSWGAAAVTGSQGGITPSGSASLAYANNSAPVAGTLRTFTEGLLNGVLQSCFYNGGNPDTIMMCPSHRQIFSTFVGNGVGSSIATRYDDASDNKVSATVSIYESDFGTLKAVANRFIDTAAVNKNVYVLESDTLAVNYLRNSVIEDLAVTGDYQSKMILSEFGLQVNNILANGSVRDIT